MRTEIFNVNIVLRDRIIENGVCAYSDGVIDYVGDVRQTADKSIDGKNAYLMAGFIDMHIHGGFGLEFIDSSKEEMVEIAKKYLAKGTTTLVPTTSTDEMWALEECLDKYRELLDAGENLTLTGFHLEGPYFNALECGAQVPSLMQIPTEEGLNKLFDKYPFISRISAAPEIDNGMLVGKVASERGIVASVGHSAADFDTVLEAKKNGYTLLTHFYSGMRGVVRVNAYRVAGAVEAGYYDDDLYVEIIADGKHLPPQLLKLIVKVKPLEKICLITDAIRPGGFPDGTKAKSGRLAVANDVIVEDGVAKLPDRTSFAGSICTMDRTVRVMHDLAGCSLSDITVMASENPAKVLKLSDRGVIAQGKRADLVLMDKDLQVQQVIFNGNVVD